jgi:hypothetical protein
MPIYKVEGPDGRVYSVEGPEGASPDDVVAFVRANYKQLKPKEGIGAAVGKGLESLISSGKTAIGSLTGSPEEAAKAALERGEDIDRRYAQQVSLDKVKEAYEKKGVLSAAGEAISQVPAAIAEQVPNIATTLGGARAGAALGSFAGPAGTVVGGIGGALLPSLIQQFGGNIERQAAEQKQRGEPLTIDRGAAALAAAPQAALDVAGTFIPLGGRLVSKLTGIPEKALFGRTAEQASKLADERLLATLAKGTATGALAEIPTEITQQMLQRAQAGLSLTDEEALKEYGETAYQVGLLAPIGAAGRFGDRSAARGERAQQQEVARQEEQMRQLQEEETKKEEDRIAKETAKQEAEAAKQQAIAAKAEEKRLAQARKLGTPELLAQMGDETVVGKFSELPDAERARTEQLNSLAKQLGYTDDEIKNQPFDVLQSTLRERVTTDLEQAKRVVPDLLNQLKDARAKQDMQRVISLSKQLEKMVPAEESLKGTLKQLDKLTPAEADLGSVRKALDKALDNGDFAKAQTLAAQLEKLQTTQAGLERKTPSVSFPGEVKALPTEQLDMFAPGFEERFKQEDIEELQNRGASVSAQPGVETAAQKKAAEQQTALFESEQEYEEVIKTKEEGKKKALTPEEYAESLSRGIDPDFVGPEAQTGKAAPKVLYRRVPSTSPKEVTRSIPYIVDEKGVSRDLTEKEAKELQEQEPKVAKTGVDEAIDSGIINSEVKDILGLKGLSNRKLDLNVIEDAEFVEGKLRAKLDASKQKAQELLDQYMADPFAENNLYDTEGNLSEKAKEILWRDMQAQELERLLKHIEEGKRGRRTAAGEERLAEKVVAAPERKATIDTTLPPIEKMEAKDANELAQVMGVSGVAELKAADNEEISAQRHTLEAKRQKEAKDEAYEKLVQALEGQRTSKDEPHKYDLVRLSKLRTQYVQAALKEAAHLRAAQRQSPLSSAQILQATNDMYDSLKELSTRYVAKPVKEMVVTRVNKLEQMQERLAELSKLDWANNPELAAKRSTLVANINKLVESQQRPIRNKIAAKQKESMRLRDQMERYRNSELEPARQKWLAMPEGPVGSQAYIARDQMQQRYLLRKKKFDGFAEHDSRVTQDITDLMKRLDEPRYARGRKLKDVRPASQRPFADRQKAVETIKDQLEAAEAKLLAKPERKRVEVSEIERRQGLLAQIKEKEDQLAALKNKQGETANREKLTKEIAALTARYEKQETELATRQKAPEIPTSFKERRDEAAELETQIKEAFADKSLATQLKEKQGQLDDIKDQPGAEEARKKLTAEVDALNVRLNKHYEGISKLLARMQQLDLGEDLASELGTDLEYNQRVLERAIKDTQSELDALVNIPPGKEVKVGQTVPRRGLSEEQQQQLKQLNKRMEALQKSLAQNQASLDDIGLFAAKGVDTTTEDLFAPTAEQGVIFETPEQFLGSAKYGKIAKLRKDLARVVNTMPVSFEDLQKARTDYVTALSALEKLRKTPDATQFNYYGELSGQYAIQAENMRKKAMESAAAGNKTSRTIGNIQDKEATRLQAKADLYEKMANNAKLLDISKYSTELQQVVVEAKLAGLNIEEDSREIGLSMAQKNVERLKTAMNDMDELARKNGTTTPIVKEKPEDIPEGDALQKQIGSVNKQIAAVRKRMESEEPDQRTQSQYEIQGLLGYRQDLETEQFMRTAEGRLYQLKQSFLEEYSADIDPTDPMKTALGRAIARSREYIPETAAKDAEKLEELLKSQKEVSDALAKYKAAAPSDEDVAKNYWMGRFEVAKLEEDLAKLNDSVAEAQARITAAQDAEVQMLRRADSALKDAWAKVKAAEKALTYKDEKQANDLVKRRKALILTQKALDDAKETSRLKAKAQQERIQTGAGIPSTKVTRVKALSEEGRKAAYAAGKFGESREVQTMNAGWTVEYTSDGPVFNYNPKDDSEATAADKKRKNVTAKKAYDSLKKARKAYRNALTTFDQRRIDVAKEKLDAQELFMEDLAGARYVSVKEVVGSTPTELDTKWQVSQEINRLPKKEITTYTNARAEQEKLRKEIEHVRTLKGQTEISQQRTAVRNAQNQYDKIAYELSEVKRKQEYDISTLSESAYDRRVKDLTQQLDKTKARLAELSTRLKPMEVKNEERLADLTKRYFAAKKIADEILLGKPETDTKGATRAPIAENVKDMKGAMRTLARDEKNSDIKPLIKQNQKLKTASTEEQRVRRAAEGFAKKDRLVTMYSKGSPEYNKALKEVTGGYVKRLIDSTDDTDGTVFRVEAESVLNPIAEAEAKAIADKFASKLPKDVKFIYAPTLSQAPVKYLKALSNAGVNVETSSVKGGVLPDGTIVVIGDQHTDALDLEKTLIHEAVGHYGVDVVLGPQGMMDLTKAIRTTEGGIFGMAKALGVEEDVLASATAWEQRAVEAEQKGEAEVAQKIRRMGEIQSVREMLAHMQEATVNETFVQKAGRYIKVVLGALRQWLRSMGMPGLSQVSTNELYYTMFQATKRMQQEFAGTYESPTGLISLRTNYATPELAAAGAIVDKVVAKDKNLYDKIKANGSGLAFETQMVDRFAGFERLSKGMEKLKGTQMLYYLRMYDQRMNFVAQSVGNGALQRVEKTRADGRKEYIIESVKGPSIRSVAEILKRAAPLVGSPDGASRLFTLYLAGIRAQNKGLETLGFNGKITQAELDSANRAINNTPGLKDLFETARAEYNAYNEGLVRFAAQTHALPRSVVEKLLASKDYIPYYRQRNGVVELLIGGENPVKIGNIKEQPYLQELVGGDEPILDFMTSAVQNTNLLTDMALRNQATSNAVFELVDLGLATITRKPIAGTNVVRFKVEPDPKNEKDKDTGERYALIATDKAGVPADILVKGMEGIPSQMPFALRAMAAPATFLRKAVTASPLYAARQLFRDSLAAPLLTGADFFPVTGALKEIGSATKGTLESRGVTGGQVFTGGSEDLTKILRDITAGRGVFSELLSRAEAISMEADALTRRAQYNSYIKQGLSEMEATYMALESMNFNKRGASPSIHWANSLIPFFNAQIQGLNVLYKAMTGNLPFNERLKIQEKLLTRGLMIAAGTLAYAASMQDDEAYKNATPDQKYGNWFVRIPGVEEPLRIPIPFEIGYIFKALPEALYNSMMNEHGSEEAVKAFNQILIQTIPGGTSMATVDVGGFKVPTLLPIPQAMKPIIETSLGKSFYTGRDILSKGEQQLLPEAQFRENTTEIAKAYGAAVGASPVKVEEFIKGYTGTMGLAFLQVVSSPFSSEGSPEKTYKRLSERAVIGGAFQPNDAGEIINSTFNRMNEFAKVKQTVDDYIERGEKSKALELIETRGREYMLGEISGDFTKQIGELTQYERAVRASDLTPEEKRERLAEIRQMKIKLSSMVRAAVDRTELQ